MKTGGPARTISRAWRRHLWLAAVFLATLPNAPAADPPQVVTSSLQPAELQDFGKNPFVIQSLISSCLELTTRSLGYKMGSADPAQGGMDCSGAIYYVLKQAGVTGVPRSSHEQYRWVWESGHFRAVSGGSFDSFEFSALKPGDLLFWTGTYTTDKRRDPPISHVMLYLGRTTANSRRVMFGASDGRVYLGKPHFGVSVFDFQLPSQTSSSRFVGYGPIPNLPAHPSSSAPSPNVAAQVPFVGPPAPPRAAPAASKKPAERKFSPASAKRKSSKG